MMKLSTLFFHTLCVGSSLWLYGPAQAAKGGISLDRSRIIFNAGDKAQTLNLLNQGDKNYLLQSRVLLAEEGEETAAPFIITPPMFKLTAQSSQTLRILSSATDLPADKESLFTLAIRAIPAGLQSDVDASQVSMGMRFNLKLIYRPTRVAAPSAGKICSLRFSNQTGAVRIDNPTPWVVTLINLKLDNHAMVSAPPLMLLPGESHAVNHRSAQQAQWQAVDDYGGLYPACQTTITAIQETS
ncbi:fimbrial biogenesis chaperone [Candidatus Pantoea multigeneris]|nr:molecular chaperone [Pantoea multigeneris]